MDEINDNEFMPNQDALTQFHPDNNTEKPALSVEFWRMFDLSEQKLTALDNRHRQQGAVVQLVKKDLAQKLQTFLIIYYVTFFFVLFIGACASRFIPDLRQPDKLKLIIASNGIYFCFLMTLSLFYELKLKVKWYFSLGTFILLAWSPYIYEHFVVPVPLRTFVWLGILLAIPLSIGFFSLSPWGKHLLAKILRIRQRNEEENRKRTEFVRTVSEAVPMRGCKARILLRRFFLRSALREAYPILICNECEDKQAALEEYKKRHRFKDSMGRLSTTIWIAGGLAYLFLSIIPEIQAIPVAAASVLPVYALSMLIMDQIDETRDKALEDVIHLVRPVEDQV